MSEPRGPLAAADRFARRHPVAVDRIERVARVALTVVGWAWATLWCWPLALGFGAAAVIRLARRNERVARRMLRIVQIGAAILLVALAVAVVVIAIR